MFAFMTPESYASRARIALEHEATGLQTQQSPSSPGDRYDPVLIQTECGLIRSEVILDPVIGRLDLNDVWSKKYNYDGKFKTTDSRAALKPLLEVKPVRGTSLIDITVYSDDKLEAANIANSIAEVYKDYRETKAKERTAQLLDEVKQELAAEGQKMDGQAEEDRISEIITRIGKRADAEGLPRVAIVDHAEPAARPSRPNKAFNILIGGLIAFVVAVLAGTVAAAISWAARPNRKAAFPR